MRRLAVVSLLGAVTTTFTMSTVFAFTASPATAATPDLGVLVGQDEYVAGVEGATLHLTVSARDLPTDSAIAVTSYRPVRTRVAFREVTAGDLPGVVDTVLIGASDVPRDDAGYLAIEVPVEIGSRTSSALQMSAAGIYPVSIGIVVDKLVVDQIVTFVERLPSDVSSPGGHEPLQVALLTGFSGPVTLQPDFSTDVDAAALDATVTMVTALEDLDMVPVSILARPEWIDALARLGDEGTSVLERIDALQSVQLFSSTYVDVSADDLVSEGLSDVMLTQLRRGEDTLASHLPTLSTRRDTFLATTGLSAESSALIRDLGFRSVVLTSDAQNTTAKGALFFADTTRLIRLSFDGGSLDAAVADPYLSATLTLGSTPGADAFLASERVLAEIKLLRSELESADQSLSGRAVFLATADGSPPSATLVAALMDALATEPDIVATTIDEALDSTDVGLVNGRPVSLDLPPNVATDSPVLASLDRQLRTLVESFAPMLPDGDVRVEMWRALLEVLPDRSLSTTEREAYVRAVEDQTRAIAASIVPPSSTTFTLGGRDSSIRITLRNDGDSDLSVQVRLTSSKLRFPSQSDPVLLPANTTTSIEVSVEARSNGRFPVTLQLFTPDGAQPIGAPVTFTARVNALAGLGQLVTGVALLLLLSWWAHHLRRERRSRSEQVDQTSARHPSTDRSGS
ncbi:MAG: DUF6049 family protein [Actinomycetota bacterium]